MGIPPTDNLPTSAILNQLLGRGDIWVGCAKQTVARNTVSSGVELLDTMLLGGWPLGSLLEICLQGATGAEWILLSKSLAAQGSRPIFLLNPPMIPFGPALVEMGIDLNRVFVVRTDNKVSFVNAFVELARASHCSALLAWQPKESLTYTELRKFLLACSGGNGLYSLIRPASAQRESSPATLRLAVSVHGLDLKLSIFKQRGMLENYDTVVRVALRDALNGHLPLNHLHEIQLPGIPMPNIRRKFNNVIPLRRR